MTQIEKLNDNIVKTLQDFKSEMKYVENILKEIQQIRTEEDRLTKEEKIVKKREYHRDYYHKKIKDKSSERKRKYHETPEEKKIRLKEYYRERYQKIKEKSPKKPATSERRGRPRFKIEEVKCWRFLPMKYLTQEERNTRREYYNERTRKSNEKRGLPYKPSKPKYTKPVELTAELLEERKNLIENELQKQKEYRLKFKNRLKDIDTDTK